MTPAAIGAASSVMLMAWSILYLAHSAGMISSAVPFQVAGVLSSLLAYGIALWLCAAIAAEHRYSHAFRLAWIFLGSCAAVSMLRHLLDTPLVDFIWRGYWQGPWSPRFREFLAAVALTFLAAGILAMGEAFRRMRLGFSMNPLDWMVMLAALALLSLLFYLRNDLSAARGSYSFAKWAQLFSQIMFVAAAAGCVLLRQIAKQMGGGKLAAAMGWIIAHILLRAVLVLSTALQVHLHKSVPFSEFLFPFLLNAAIWMFAIAAASRYEVSRTAERHAAKWGIAAYAELSGPALN